MYSCIGCGWIAGHAEWCPYRTTVYYTSPPDPDYHKGWECPRCHKINGPHVDQCDCKLVTISPYPIDSGTSDANWNRTVIAYQ